MVERRLSMFIVLDKRTPQKSDALIIGTPLILCLGIFLSCPIQANYHLISFVSTLGRGRGPSFGTLLRSCPFPVLSRSRIVNTPAHKRACDASKYAQPD